MQRRQNEIKAVYDEIKKLQKERAQIRDAMIKYEGFDKISTKKAEIQQLDEQVKELEKQIKDYQKQILEKR